MSAQEAKKQVKCQKLELEELKKELATARVEAQLQADEAEEARRQQDKVERESKQLVDRLEGVERCLADWENNLLTRGRGHGDDGGHSDDDDGDSEVSLRSMLEEMRDIADERLCRIEEMERVLEIEVLRTKEVVRTDLEERYRRELNARDELIELLKAQYCVGQPSRQLMETQPMSSNQEIEAAGQQEKAGDRTTDLGGGSPTETPDATGEANKEGRTRKLTLPPLPKFSGEEQEVGAFD